MNNRQPPLVLQQLSNIPGPKFLYKFLSFIIFCGIIVTSLGTLLPQNVVNVFYAVRFPY